MHRSQWLLFCKSTIFFCPNLLKYRFCWLLYGESPDITSSNYCINYFNSNSRQNTSLNILTSNDLPSLENWCMSWAMAIEAERDSLNLTELEIFDFPNEPSRNQCSDPINNLPDEPYITVCNNFLYNILNCSQDELQLALDLIPRLESPIIGDSQTYCDNINSETVNQTILTSTNTTNEPTLARYNISRYYYKCLAIREELRPRSQTDRSNIITWLQNLSETEQTSPTCLNPIPFDWTVIVIIVSAVMGFLTLCTFAYCMCRAKKETTTSR